MAALFFVLTGLLMLIGYAIGLYFGDPLAFLLLGLVIAGVVNFVSYYWSDTIVVKMSRARIIQESDNPTLYAAVQHVAQKAGIPMPRVGVVNSPQPNAFATGRGRRRRSWWRRRAFSRRSTPPNWRRSSATRLATW